MQPRKPSHLPRPYSAWGFWHLCGENPWNLGWWYPAQHLSGCLQWQGWATTHDGMTYWNTSSILKHSYNQCIYSRQSLMNRGWDGGWYHWLSGHEFEQTLGDTEEQGSLGCCSLWGSQRVRHDWVTEQWTQCFLSAWIHLFSDPPVLVRSWFKKLSKNINGEDKKLPKLWNPVEERSV